MTIRIISDREVTLQMQIDIQGKALQKAMNEVIALKAERDEYQQAADKMAMEHKVERDTLRQRIVELEQDRDEWKDSTIMANTNATREEKRRRAMQEERDTLRQQLAEAQAPIEASKKQDPVAWRYDIATYIEGDVRGRNWRQTFSGQKPNMHWMTKDVTPLYTAPVVADDVLKDAQRYQWLRDRSWWDTTVCVVADPKNSVKLGSFCPSHELLDAAIDEAMVGTAYD